MRKYSKWFKGSSKPPVVGLWQRRIYPGWAPVYAWWNGKRWSPASIFKDEALARKRDYSLNQSRPDWRGLASDPNENLGQSVARIRKAVAAKGGYGEDA
jgi:hypothetical protein